MRQTLEAIAENVQLYHARDERYQRGSSIPFEVSPSPLQLSPEYRDTIGRIGTEGAAFLQAADDLYRTDERAAGILDRGKPAALQGRGPASYLFFRPDLLLGKDGLKICELETSPFGLGLSHLLNVAYSGAGFETIVEPGILTGHITSRTPDQGVIVWDDKTAAYRGQLSYLADKVFSDRPGRTWEARHISDLPEGTDSIYRAFYLHSYLGDRAVQALVDTSGADFVPTLTPHLEEKALLTFLWDSRFELPLRRSLGNGGYDFMRSVVPPTWIIGEEASFAPGLPGNLPDSLQLASLSRAQRAFVLKCSGFSGHSSWAESVVLLQTKSKADALAALKAAAKARDELYIVQAFTDGTKVPVEYELDGGGVAAMLGRLRLTPYYDTASGALLSMKATARANTHFIHASSDSINAPVMWAGGGALQLAQSA
jgi:hypothetical protein